MILTEYNMTTFKFQCLLTIHGILQSCAVVLYRGQTFSLEEAPNCPQTIPVFLLEINFQVGVSDTGLFLSFLSFSSLDRKGKVTRSQREVTQLPSFFSPCRSMGAGLGLPDDLGGGGESQRRKKRLSSRGFERLSSTQVRVPLSYSLLSHT